MKVIVLLMSALLGQALGLGENTNDLMTTSFDYQDRAFKIHIDSSIRANNIRQAEVAFLRSNMNETIFQTRSNSNRVLSMYELMNEKMSSLVHDDCYKDLTDLADLIVSMVGFQIGVILTDHDKNVTVELGNAEDTIKRYDIISTSIQRIVHRAFIKSNLFKEPEKISQKFISEYEKYEADLEKITPEYVEIIETLIINFNRTFVNLRGNFGAMQKSFDVSFDKFQTDAVTICVNYAKSPSTKPLSSPRKIGQFKFFDPALYLPVFEI